MASLFDANMRAVLDVVLHDKMTAQGVGLVNQLRQELLSRAGRGPTRPLEFAVILRAPLRPADTVAAKIIDPLNGVALRVPDDEDRLQSVAVRQSAIPQRSGATQVKRCNPLAFAAPHQASSIPMSNAIETPPLKPVLTRIVALNQPQAAALGDRIQRLVNGAKSRAQADRAKSGTKRSLPNSTPSNRFYQELQDDPAFEHITLEHLEAIEHADSTTHIIVLVVHGDGSSNMSAATSTAAPIALILAVVAGSRTQMLVHFFGMQSLSLLHRNLVQSLSNSVALKITFDCKRLVRSLLIVPELHGEVERCLPIPNLIDTKIGVWLINPDMPPESMHFSSLLTQVRSLARDKDHHPLQFRRSPQAPCCLRLQSELVDSYFVYTSLVKQLSSTDTRLMQTLERESQLATLLAQMENDGANIQIDDLKRQRLMVAKQISDLEARTLATGGKEFNISSSDQVACLLYDDLQLSDKPIHTSTPGRRSTAEPVLQSLKDRHPVVPMILEFRALSKLLHTYIDPLIVAESKTPGIIQTTWNQTAVSTGRLSSSGPNLQALPKDSTILRRHTEETGELVNIRRTFVCGSGMVLVSADYNQMEIRVFAILAEEPALLNAISQEVDVYQVLAGIIFRKDMTTILPQERDQAKTICLAIVYGEGPKALSVQLSNVASAPCSYDQAKQFVERFYNQFPKMRDFVNRTTESCRRNGYVETITGRRRQFPDASSGDQHLRNQTKRQAVNTIIQGSSSDIMKSAMLAFAAHLRAAGLSESTRIRLQVHDELVVSTPIEHTDRVCRLLRQSMQNNELLSKLLPLPVCIRTGPNLAELYPWADTAPSRSIIPIMPTIQTRVAEHTPVPHSLPSPTLFAQHDPVPSLEARLLPREKKHKLNSSSSKTRQHLPVSLPRTDPSSSSSSASITFNMEEVRARHTQQLQTFQYKRPGHGVPM